MVNTYSKLIIYNTYSKWEIRYNTLLSLSTSVVTLGELKFPAVGSLDHNNRLVLPEVFRMPIGQYQRMAVKVSYTASFPSSNEASSPSPNAGGRILVPKPKRGGSSLEWNQNGRVETTRLLGRVLARPLHSKALVYTNWLLTHHLKEQNHCE